MLRRALLLLSVMLAPALAAEAQAAPHHFTFQYSFTVKNVAPGQRLRVWIPLAHSDEWQEVRVLSESGDLPLKPEREREYGNRLLYAETVHAGRSEYRFTVNYDVVRRERAVLAGGKFVAAADPARSRELSRFLEPDKLVPVTGPPAQLAAEQTAGKATELEKAQAIYDYVFHTLRYDKSGTGWGRGDALWACDAKHGNCTDFHSLFVSMARSQKIPARFEIGFPVPADQASGQVTGYHCWADFYVPGRGWVPVDISEAWKAPAKHDYFFGTLDTQRVQFTLGRDLTLTPRQDGPPLNYFVYPYVEVDGAAYPNVDNAFSFGAAAGGGATAR
jgi:transglutaminase-like putative cysteine protease